MGRLEPIDNKQTKWEGLWYHPEYGGFSSASLSLADIRKFKGNVRLYVRKNKFFNGGENGRPNYHFCLKDANSEVFHLWEVEEEKPNCYWSERDECYYDNEGKRLYTRGEVRQIINGTVDDVQYGITDPYDILPEDFV